MDGYVKRFIAMSILYLGVASVFGVMMLVEPAHQGSLKFAHSHFMLLGWVSMMIYGVGYHILPRFAGRLLKNPLSAEIQFWFANAGLIGMVVFYTLLSYRPDVQGYRYLVGVSGVLQVLSSVIFFYNMMKTIFAKQEKPA